MGQRHIKERLSNAQVVTVSAGSTVSVDKSTTGDGKDGLYLEFKVGIAFAGGTSVVFKLQSDTDSGFATALITHAQTDVILTAALVAGAVFRLAIPPGLQQHIRAYYTIDGTMSGGGTFNANIVDFIDVDNTPIT